MNLLIWFTNSVFHLLHCAESPSEDCHRFEGAVFGYDRLVIAAVQLTAGVGWVRRITAVQSIIYLSSRCGAGEGYLCPGSHCARLRLCLRRRYGSLSAASLNEFVQGELGRVTVWITVNRSIFICSEFILAAFIAGQSDSVIPLSVESEFTVAFRPGPAVFSSLDAVFISAFRSNGLPVAVR